MTYFCIAWDLKPTSINESTGNEERHKDLHSG